MENPSRRSSYNRLEDTTIGTGTVPAWGRACCASEQHQRRLLWDTDVHPSNPTPSSNKPAMNAPDRRTQCCVARGRDRPGLGHDVAPTEAEERLRDVRHLKSTERLAVAWYRDYHPAPERAINSAGQGARFICAKSEVRIPHRTLGNTRGPSAAGSLNRWLPKRAGPGVGVGHPPLVRV